DLDEIARLFVEDDRFLALEPHDSQLSFFVGQDGAKVGLETRFLEEGSKLFLGLWAVGDELPVFLLRNVNVRPREKDPRKEVFAATNLGTLSIELRHARNGPETQPALVHDRDGTAVVADQGGARIHDRLHHPIEIESSGDLAADAQKGVELRHLLLRFV